MIIQPRDDGPPALVIDGPAHDQFVPLARHRRTAALVQMAGEPSAEEVLAQFASADADLPTLRGDAVTLIEAMSLRAPLPDETSDEWRRVVAGLATAFG